MPYEANEWMTARDAAEYAKVGVPTIYIAARSGKLRAALVAGTGNRNYRFLRQWIDQWLMGTAAMPVTTTPEP